MQGRKSKGVKAANHKDAKKKVQSSATQTTAASAKDAVGANAKTKSVKKGAAAAKKSAAQRQTAQQAPASSATSASPKAKTNVSTPEPALSIENPTSASPRTISRSEWHHEVELAAYRRAELRHFAPGGEEDDWIEAEADVNERLLRLGIQVVD